MPCRGKTISRLKNTTICCGFVEAKTAAYGDRFSIFGFVAVSSAGNEVSIDENIPVGYKGKSGILDNAAVCSVGWKLLTID